MKRFSIEKKQGMSNIQMLIILMGHLDELKDGIYDIIVESHHAKASHRQFGWLFGGIYARLIPAFNELGWEMTNTDDVDRFFAAMFRDREVVNRNTAEVMHIPLSLSEMTTVEMSEYCERLLDFCRENFPAIDVEELLPENYRKRQGGEDAAAGQGHGAA